MFWLDRIFGQIEEQLKDKLASGKPLLVRDEKTASGRVHVGSMRALALHAAISERLGEAGIAHTFKYEINDFDPMDGLPVYLDEATYKPHMGKPLYYIPSPDAGEKNSAKNFAEYFAKEYIEAIAEAGFAPEFYRASDLYLTGKMNDAIREALDGAAAVRKVYKEVSGAERADDWYPLNVICENCGKVGTTKVYAWDGEKVGYKCYKTAVKWAEGCEHEGQVSPFDGKAKLPWKVEWPAKWKVVGVDIEGGGKDHYSKGGARDVARRIAHDVFNYPEPFGVPNEFFLIGGQKMSSSKGAGASAKDIVELIPPKIFRLALYGKDINQQINFDPEGDTIPVLYDQYDKLAEGYAKTKDDDYARLFEYIHMREAEGSGQKSSDPLSGGAPRLFVRNLPPPETLPRFSQVAFVVQMPHMDLDKEFPTADKAELAERAKYAKRWLDKYAPEKFVFKLQESLPEAATALSAEQKAKLAEFRTFLQGKPDASADDMHAKLHELKAFKEIYVAFLAKESGPKAGWFLAALPRDFVLLRLSEASVK